MSGVTPCNNGTQVYFFLVAYVGNNDMEACEYGQNLTPKTCFGTR